MMKKCIASALGSILFTASLLAQENWKPAGDKIRTAWAAEIQPSNPLPEYPRPQLQRENNWMNLNGSWKYTILPKETIAPPADFIGTILVPYPVESSLSGVGKTVGKDSVLWYEKTISLSSKFKSKRVLLHFGAVDWLCEVFVNGKSVGSHKGGYDPFSFDITGSLLKKGNQKISIRVWDPTDEGPQPRGKQVRRPESIWYTPVTGIWQTVWLEAVPETYISSIRQTPDIDRKKVSVKTNLEGMKAGDNIAFSVWRKGQKITEQVFPHGEEATLNIENPELWSPSSPALYDLRVSVVRNGKTIDAVKTYFAMRKISMGTDKEGIKRMLLNNDFLFQYGPLDQGWWPDGLYTAPTDAALRFDIEKTKEMGFNMIRKHVKVEPARWYYYCDSIGLMVWQDMPSGDLGNQWEMRPGVYGKATDKDRTPESEASFRSEWKEIMDDFYHFPSIVVWVPFNEAWGQFKTKEIVEWTMKEDPSRLVNTASGGNFESVGHITDLHNYPEPLMPDPELFGKDRILVLGEFGGLGLPVENHTWQDKNNWGYQSFKNSTDLQKRYAEFIDRIPALIKKGLSAAVYTQTTDVEVETNGLMTYDRKIIKIAVEALRKIHAQLYNPGLVQMK